MKRDQALVNAAAQLLDRRFGDSGPGGTAAMYTTTGRILTSISVEALLDAANLCIETAAIAEAHKWNEPVTASVCLVRSESESPRVVTACGHCRERLRFCGARTSPQVVKSLRGGLPAYAAAAIHPVAAPYIRQVPYCERSRGPPSRG